MRQRGQARRNEPAALNASATLSPEVTAQIGTYMLDRLITTHELISWKEILPHSTLVRLRGYTVLLPISADHTPYLTALRLYIETHRSSLILVLRNMGSMTQPHEADALSSLVGTQFLVVCEQIPQQAFFIATLYHAYHSDDT